MTVCRVGHRDKHQRASSSSRIHATVGEACLLNLLPVCIDIFPGQVTSELHLPFPPAAVIDCIGPSPTLVSYKPHFFFVDIIHTPSHGRLTFFPNPSLGFLPFSKKQGCDIILTSCGSRRTHSSISIYLTAIHPTVARHRHCQIWE